MPFTVVIEKRALKDAQQAIDYYDEQRIGVGEKFNNALDKHISAIGNNPFYQLRYKDYRALRIKKFPFLFYFTLMKLVIPFTLQLFFTQNKTRINCLSKCIANPMNMLSLKKVKKG